MLRSNAETTIRKSMAMFVDNEVSPQAKEIDEYIFIPRISRSDRQPLPEKVH